VLAALGRRKSERLSCQFTEALPLRGKSLLNTRLFVFSSRRGNFLTASSGQQPPLAQVFWRELEVLADCDGGGTDFLSIRGRRIYLDKLWDERRLSGLDRRGLKGEFLNALPFPHLSIDSLFDEKLLELIVEEFDGMTAADWGHSKSANQSTRRSHLSPALGSASQQYFNTIYSSHFLEFLCDITGSAGLVPDPTLFGGGLHESRTGDWFGVHVDFTHHGATLLNNELVLITYLNRGWRDEYGGSLELWDADAKACVKTILPLFGRTVIMKHGVRSLHGHTRPVNAPHGRSRRSLASYYYRRGPERSGGDAAGRRSAFLTPRTTIGVVSKSIVRQICPPILLSAVLRAKRGWLRKDPWADPVGNLGD
jgi:Rps23 Pro-64 3,4-dihydroxylase Tpa1-like proline 4-hydroxylase